MKPLTFSRTFFKYLFSYVVVLSIPILILFFFVYHTFMNVLTDNIMDKNLDMLQQVKSTLDSQVDELKKTAILIGQDPDLSRQKSIQDIFITKNPINVLKNYTVGNNFVEEILLYHRGENLLYSSSSVYSPSSFINHIYNYKNWSEEDFLNDINTLNTPVFRLAEEVVESKMSNSYITFVVPLPYDFPVKSSTLIFMISEKSVKNMLESLVKNTRGNVVIMDKQFRVIAGLNQIDVDDRDLNAVLEKSTKDASKIIMLNNTKYLFSCTDSEILDWSYITLMPLEDVVAPLSDIKARALYGILIIFILSLIAIYIAMHYNYTPLKRLKIFSEEIVGSRPNQSNEIDSVRNAIEHLSRTTHVLKDKIENNKDAIRDSLILDLIKGNFSSIEEFNQKGSEFGIVITHTQYAVVIFHISNKELLHNKNIRSVIQEIESVLAPDIQAYGKDNIAENTFVFVLSMMDNNYKVLKKSYEIIQNKLYEQIDLKVTIGIGNIYDKIGEIGKSFIEASAAIDYRLVKGKNSIIFFNEVIPAQTVDNFYPKQEIEQIEFLLMQNNFGKASGLFNDIIVKIKEHNLPIFTLRIICFDIINTVAKSIENIYRQFPGSPHENATLLELMKFETIDELANEVRNIFFEISRYLNEYNDIRRNQRIKEYFSFIQENYLDYNFSAQRMADYCNISVSNLSHNFKKHTGQSLTDYVNALRIEQAKKLLATTELNIQDIVEQIGYVNLSSFIRKFKQVTGTTPGNFRISVKGKDA